MTVEPDNHFLVVDDDEDSRRTIVEYLKAMGYARISSAKDGAEAVRMLNRDTTINFIISDWDMPLMDGLSLLQRIKFDSTRSQIPFLIVTSPVSKEAEKVIMAAENLVDGYLIKPFRSNALQDKIKHILQFSIRGPQKRVLVVDDDPDARETVMDYLKHMGFKDIFGLNDGKAGLAYLMEHMDEIGLIVSDWEMPEMSGLDLLKTCKQHPELKEIPFLMVTSQSSIERMKVMQAAQAKVDQYLLKPFKQDDIKGKIEKLLERSKHHGEAESLLMEGIDNLERGKYPQAQKCFESVLKIDSDNDIALRGMGDTLMKLKGVQAAMPFFKKAVEANPLNPKGYIKLAVAYEQVGLGEKALALLQSGIQQINFSADLHFHLGQLYQKRDMVDLARTEFEKTLDIQLDHQEARLMLTMLDSKRKKE